MLGPSSNSTQPSLFSSTFQNQIPPSLASIDRAWWKESVVYQIYPRSFNDSNGDGCGDIRGIIEKLDYLKYLGVNVIWLTPVYLSPNFDNGYDVSGYTDINPEYGTLSDIQQLIHGVHSRGMKIIMDLVVNHTSHLHPWFLASKQSRVDNEFRDFYFWRPGKGDSYHEPNNWGAIFGGPAWKYDPQTKEYYLHTFSEHQPDLNWENPRVRQEVFKILEYWLTQGIDGFRMDVINHISKVPGLPDAPITAPGKPYQPAYTQFIDGPKVHDYIREMNEKVLSKHDIMTVGEMPLVSVENALNYVTPSRKELNMVFQFDHMSIDSPNGNKWMNDHCWKLTDLKRIAKRWQVGLFPEGWNSIYLCNHDQPRTVSRFGNDSSRYRVRSAKMLATLLFTHRGTPYIYQGEEIGMTNVQFESIDSYRDIETLNYFQHEVIHASRAVHEVMEEIHQNSRDNARTPMQWSPENGSAGFTEGTPWIEVNPNYRVVNVARDMQNPDSILQYYRQMINLRKRFPILIYGDYIQVMEDHQRIFAYLRRLDDNIALIIMNFYECHDHFQLPTELHIYGKRQLLMSNYDDTDEMCEDLNDIELRPYEARVYHLSRH